MATTVIAEGLPSGWQKATQLGYLQPAWLQGILPTFQFRQAAEPHMVQAHKGQTLTFTIPGMFAPNASPIDLTNFGNIDNGMTASYNAGEQVTLTMNLYGGTTNVDNLGAYQSTGKYLLDVISKMGVAAGQSLDYAARNTILDAYMGQNTAIDATLGAPGTTIAVDDIRGFDYVIDTTTGIRTATSASTPMAIQIWDVANSVWSTHSVTGVAADGTNTSKAAAFGGISGTLTLAANATVAQGTLGNAVVAVNAPQVIRAGAAKATGLLTSSNVLTMAQVQSAVAALRANNVPTIDGMYHLYITPAQFFELYQDTQLQSFFRGGFASDAWRMGQIDSVNGLRVFQTSQMPTQVGTLGSATLNVQRAVVCGAGAIIEGRNSDPEFGIGAYPVRALSKTIYEQKTNASIVLRPGIDRFGQVPAISWNSLTGFVARTDALLTPTLLPQASNAYYKRAVILESV